MDRIADAWAWLTDHKWRWAFAVFVVGFVTGSILW